MGVFSNEQIRRAISTSRILCLPYDETRVGQASLGLTLGFYYYRIEAAGERTVYNPLDREDVERHFDGPYKAMPHEQWCRLSGTRPFAGIPPQHPVIAIRPGERILAHTHEFFGITAPGACEIKGQAVWERNGITICSGGWIEPGSITRHALEICNLNQHGTVLLPVGERIAQAVFYVTGGEAGSGEPDGVHQVSVDLDMLVRTWTPSLLLPEAWQDARNLPPKIEGPSYD